METITAKFARLFDPKNVLHVTWLMQFFELSKVALDITKKTDVSGFMNKNPMGITVKDSELLDWVQIHFTVSMKYMKYFFDGQAYIPPSCKT